mgnify:CR=1 FL=1
MTREEIKGNIFIGIVEDNKDPKNGRKNKDSIKF